MKLYDLAMKLDHPEMNVLLIDKRTWRTAFEGTADSLLDYSGLDYRCVCGISIKEDTLCIVIK